MAAARQDTAAVVMVMRCEPYKTVEQIRAEVDALVPRRPRRGGYVYVISSTSGHYKIGVSSTPKKRLKQLRYTEGPFEYELLFTMRRKGEAAYDLERALHNEFKDKHVRGEWFDLDAEDIECIKQYGARSHI